MKDIKKYLKTFTNKKLLVVFPHPDDESVMAGGLILAALDMGWEVSVLTLTEGDGGKIYINGGGRSTREIRRQEMAEAMGVLGVMDWVMWDFRDGELRRGRKWNIRLEKFIEITDPGLLVSYDPSGVSGHPDHIAVGLKLMRLARKKKIPVIWPSFEGELEKRLVNKGVKKYLNKPELRLDLEWQRSWKKWKAAFAHKSQRLSGFIGMPRLWAVFKLRTEWYGAMKPEKKYKYRYVKFRL